jgi:DUF1680 family protein
MPVTHRPSAVRARGPVCLALATALAAALSPLSLSAQNTPTRPAATGRLFPLNDVRLLESPFSAAARANRAYLLALDADRLLAPFFREAGLQPKKPPYPNWESQGLDGHTGGHYLSALADMIASGHDPDGELGRRLDYTLAELQRVQKANADGYIGGVPGSKAVWQGLANGDTNALRGKWVPWYNVHKTFAGLRDAFVYAKRPVAKEMLVSFSDWAINVTAKLSDEQMQRMLGTEHGGMNETLADAYVITGDKKYLDAAKRFTHRGVVDPLTRGEDRLTGLHANTQIPKIIGIAEIANITGDAPLDRGARFFWDNVVNRRSVAFGGNSVSEHFNNPNDFGGMLQNIEGPETCNTYNMLRLTEKLFSSKPDARYADYYERALYNHILSTIDAKNPGFVYFTPIRPGHYRVYSQPETSFWCCVGTGIENPGRYGQFIYAKDNEALYVNLFIPSELKPETPNGITLRQETKFPYEPSTKLTVNAGAPKTLALRIRHPWWVPEGKLTARVNGQPVSLSSKPSTFVELRREWKNGDIVEVGLPMHITAERLPDQSNWAALLYGPIVLAAPATFPDAPNLNARPGELANAARMAHVAAGPRVPIDKAPFLLTTSEVLPRHVTPATGGAPLTFTIKDVVEPKGASVTLKPFFDLGHERYQMYFELVSAQDFAQRREQAAARDRLLVARDAATLDRVAPGEQQSEVEHDMKTEDSTTGLAEDRRWRGNGRTLSYALDPKGEKAGLLEITYNVADRARTFDILVEGKVLASESLSRNQNRQFIAKRYPLPADLLTAAPGKRLTVQFADKNTGLPRIVDIRLMKPDAPESPEK